MLRWTRVPAAVFVLSFSGSLAYLELDNGTSSPPGRAAEPTPGPGRLVVTYSATARNPDQGFLGSMRPDGTDLRNVISAPGEGRAAANGAPSPAPDGRSVVFHRAVAGPEGAFPPYIHIIRLDGSSPEHRITRGRAAEVDPAWSPDGERIAFAREAEGGFDLFECAPDGSGLAQLTDTPGVDELTPAWSPDGARIAFARYEEGLEDGPGSLWLVTADGRGERRLRGGDGHDYSAPAWAPDGKRLALLMDGHVAVTDPHGKTVRGLTADEEPKETRPSWSPDGTRIAFTRDPGTILIVRPDGSQPRQVPFANAATGVAWVAAR